MRSTWSVFVVFVLLMACGNDDTNEFTASGVMEGTSVNVAAQTGGEILAFYLEEGEAVKIDQVIAVIDTEKLSFRREQIQAGLDEVSVQREISANTLKRAKIEHDHVEEKYRRFLDLYEKNSASKQTLDDLKSAYDVASIQIESARQNLNLIESKRKQLEAERKLLDSQIRDAQVRSPANGTITTKYFETGETAPTGAPLVEVIDLNEMWIKVYVSETLLPAIKLGQGATIRVDGREETLQGKVTWISPKAEFTPKNILTDENRTALVYAVKVVAENPDGILKHGMPVKVILEF